MKYIVKHVQSDNMKTKYSFFASDEYTNLHINRFRETHNISGHLILKAELDKPRNYFVMVASNEDMVEVEDDLEVIFQLLNGKSQNPDYEPERERDQIKLWGKILKENAKALRVIPTPIFYKLAQSKGLGESEIFNAMQLLCSGEYELMKQILLSYE